MAEDPLLVFLSMAALGVSYILGLRLFNWWLNPITIFFSIQLGQFALYHAGILPVFALKTQTIWTLVLSWSSYLIGVITVVLFTSNRSCNPGRMSAYPVLSDLSRRTFLWLGGVVLTSIAIDLFVTLQFFQHITFDFTDARQLRRIVLQRSESSATQISGLGSMVLYAAWTLRLAAFPLLGALIWFALKWRGFRLGFSTLIVGLAIGVAIVVYAYINLSRFRLIVNTLLVLSGFIAAALSMRDMDRRAAIKLWLLLLSLSAVVFAFFITNEILLNKSRHFAEESAAGRLVSSWIWYFIAPLAAFNESIEEIAELQWFGGYAFMSLYKIAEVLTGLEYQVPIHLEFVFVPYVANTYTYLYQAMSDFGIHGGIAYPYALGGLFAIAWAKLSMQLSLRWLVIFGWALTSIVMSFFAAYFVDVASIFFAFLVAWAIDGRLAVMKARLRHTNGPVSDERRTE